LARFDFLRTPLYIDNQNVDTIKEFTFNKKFSRTPATTLFVREMRNYLEATKTMMAFRMHDTDFTRERYYTFPRLVTSILKDHGRPTQTRVIRFFQDGGFGKQEKCATASAFNQARAKLDPAFFESWADLAVHYYYANFPKEELVATWRGHYLWGIDCSTVIMPDTTETRKTFSVINNSGAPSETIYGQISFSYDLLNDRPVSFCLDKRISEKDYLINTHFMHMSGSVIAIYDRLYADYEVIARHALTDADFVIRCKTTTSFKIVDKFMQSKENDWVVWLPASWGNKPRMKKLGLPSRVKVRFVKILLDSGEIEVIVTSLLDQNKYTISDLAWLYSKRWGVETSFMRFKRQLDVECFSSRKVQNIKQDIAAGIFLLVFEAILNRAQDIDMAFQDPYKPRKREYRVNKSGAYAMISDHLVCFFLGDKRRLLEFLDLYRYKITFYKGYLCKR
nr:IS4 family transposase [Candidatus Sigynarchaeota archaeon]